MNGNVDLVYEFRPLHEGLERMLEDGTWIPDDGKWGMAFRKRQSVYYVHVAYQENLLWAWDGGDWGRNDHRHQRGNPWHYMIVGDKFISYDNRRNHQNTIAGKLAMSTTCHKFNSASGSGVDFHINNPYIKAGLVRNADTKDLIKFPDIFICKDCGDIQNEIDRPKTED